MIPRELTNIPQWVCTYSNSKVPMQSKVNKAASCSNPDTWSDFESAINNSYNYTNVGFVLNNNNIVIVDIDDCVSGGVPNDFALDIIFRLKSYTEISRSGTGIHIVCRGNIPFDGKNNHERGIEIYQNKRYVIITGNSFLFNTVCKPQEEINVIVDEFFVETQNKAIREPNKGIPTNVIYSPMYNMKHDGKIIDFSKTYPVIGEGGRNHCLTSYGGQLVRMGFTDQEVFRELLKCNEAACKPQLDSGEIAMIVRSVMRYG